MWCTAIHELSFFRSIFPTSFSRKRETPALIRRDGENDPSDGPGHRKSNECARVTKRGRVSRWHILIGYGTLHCNQILP